jgi:hypothetical protein
MCSGKTHKKLSFTSSANMSCTGQPRLLANASLVTLDSMIRIFPKRRLVMHVQCFAFPTTSAVKAG